MEILDLLARDSYIIVNKDLIKILGINEAIIIGELASEYRSWKNKNMLVEDMFYSTIENVEENTGLNEYLQRKTFKRLNELNIISYVVKGIPAKRYIKINQEELIKIFSSKFFNDLSSSSLNFKELDIENLRVNNNNTINNKNNNNIFSLVEEGFGRTLNGIEYEEISKWPDTELTRYAIKQAILSGGRSVKYIQTILNSYKAKGILTIDDAIKNESKYKNKTQNVPDWFDKKIENEERELTDEERKIYEDITGCPYE